MTARSINSSLSLASNDSLMNSKVPQAKSPYNPVAQSVRRIIPEKMACIFGCNGTKCKYDNSNWPPEKMAINGLFSNWITEDILATARPRAKLINDSNLIHEMKKFEIRSIFNLQSRGEHKDCGDGNLEVSGFSYDPISFSEAGIFYYNYELEDFSVANIRRMLDMVKVLCFALTEGKVAIHCHAGLGRTGLFIACYLVYQKRLTTDEAIFFIREKRPGSVQMTEQINAVRDFENYLKPLRIIYVDNFYLPQKQSTRTGESDNAVSIYDKSFNLRIFLSRQRSILHGFESKKLKYIPKILYVCGEQIKKISSDWKSNGIRNKKILNRFRDFNNLSSRDSPEKIRNYDTNSILAKAMSTNLFSNSVIKRLNYYQKIVNETTEGMDELMDESDPSVLIALIWSWLSQLDQPVLNDQAINILLKNYLNGYSSGTKNKVPLNWKDLDKETIHTTNYLITIIHSIIPLPLDLENDLIIQLISSLSQTKLKNEEENNDEQNIPLINPINRMKQKNVDILCEIIKELIKDPVKISEKSLGNFNFGNSPKNSYDYEENVQDYDTDDTSRRQSRSRLRKNNSN